jgi:alkylation response protein AidB-like acyl-CoA dehydrogenase
MDFGLTEEQGLAGNRLRRFLTKEIRPYAEEYKEKLVPKYVMHELLKKIISYGFLVGDISEEPGGNENKGRAGRRWILGQWPEDLDLQWRGL